MLFWIIIIVIVLFIYFEVHDGMRSEYSPYYTYYICPKGKYGTSYVGVNHNTKRKVYLGYPKYDRNKQRYAERFYIYFNRFPDCFEKHPDWDYEAHRELLARYGYNIERKVKKQ